MAKAKVNYKELREDISYNELCYKVVIRDLEGTVRGIKKSGKEIPTEILEQFTDTALHLKAILKVYKTLGARIAKQEQATATKTEPVKSKSTISKKPKTKGKK